MGGYIFHLNSTFSRMPLMIKPLITPSFLYMNPTKRYNQSSKIGHQTDQEIRAPSTAEEFKRVAEQKLRAAEQGGRATQASDKIRDGHEEATLDVDKVKHDHHERVDQDQDDHDDVGR